MDRQIAKAKRGERASMILKNNSVNDPQIIEKISEASCAGVRVDMIIRGICCMRAGVPGKPKTSTSAALWGAISSIPGSIVLAKGKKPACTLLRAIS